MKTRVISAIVALAIVIPLFIIGGVAWSAGIAIVAALAYYETIGLKKSHKPYPNLIKLIGLLCTELITLTSIMENGISFPVIALSCLLLGIPAIFDKNDKYNTKDAFYTIGTTTLIGAFFGNFILIPSQNKMILVYLFLIAAVTDTFAMVIGSLIGKHKLIPAVSPKKSIEGSVGGTIVAVAVCTIFYVNLIPNEVNVFLIILMTTVLSILGQLGDLFFSKIKRENDIKDFSNIMPGHGGILDRLDSSVFIVFGYILMLKLIKWII